MTRQTAASLGLRTISDLVRAAPRLVFGGPPECRVRPLCLLGLERTYGLHFRRVVALDAGGPLTHQALSQGEASVALVFSTDPRLTAEHLVVLDDRRWGGALTTLIDGVSARLTTDELRRLNGELTDAADSPRTTAARWLTKEGVR